VTRDVAGAAPRLGRPPRLSRAAILDAALELLERAPRENLTVARIAAEVDAVPGALYRHFTSLDHVLDGVLARVLVGTQRPRIRRRAAWQGQIRDWMTSLRRALLRYPSVLTLIGRRGRTSPAWLDSVAVLVPILERAGLRGVELARTHLWLSETTVALIMQEAALSLDDQLAGARVALGEMSPGCRAQLEPLLKRLEATSADRMFAFAAAQTIAALATQVAA
jgi:AcrR family transcriptional regulator